MPEIVWDGLDDEIERKPTLTALLHRTSETCTETMWANGYPEIRMIVLTFPEVKLLGAAVMPGVIRDLHVGWRDMATAATFAARFEKHVQDYVEMGWVRQDVTEVAR